MLDLDMSWENGPVGNFFLTVGLVKQTAHVYQTPWTGDIWWGESTAFNIEKTAFSSAGEAKRKMQDSVQRWFQLATYTAETQEDIIWMFTDSL